MIVATDVAELVLARCKGCKLGSRCGRVRHEGVLRPAEQRRDAREMMQGANGGPFESNARRRIW